MKRHETGNRRPRPHAHLEPAAGHESVAKEKAARFNSPVNIHVHSIRARLADPDGISIKAALDGFVKAGILADDSAKQISSITQSQELGSPERTIFTI